MAKNHHWLPLILSLITALGLAASSLCIVSEFKRTKRKDLKLDGKLCHLPGSHAFGFGIAALICLFAAQVAGNFIVCRNSCSGEKRTRCKARKPALSTIFLLLSWISFGIAAILLSVASSMNRRQPYGKGWLDGDCYVVKDGVYIGAATLALVCVASALASAVISIRKSQTEQGQKIHAQV
ncbi:protein MODIFYING WALL LIGNIN-1 [Diospyros lotus]|uniref:protein MODIFYING WALL LIGNIN-1 n=1 Tax=Diospyros lotus TaxID=55363 RepID=UPI002251D6D3|nr:protein MODIFYING WALL LIGNIN-1 [Diospyros lotus]